MTAADDEVCPSMNRRNCVLFRHAHGIPSPLPMTRSVTSPDDDHRLHPDRTVVLTGPNDSYKFA
jgi:hypothetical protein